MKHSKEGSRVRNKIAWSSMYPAVHHSLGDEGRHWLPLGPLRAGRVDRFHSIPLAPAKAVRRRLLVAYTHNNGDGRCENHHPRPQLVLTMGRFTWHSALTRTLHALEQTGEPQRWLDATDAKRRGGCKPEGPSRRLLWRWRKEGSSSSSAAGGATQSSGAASGSSTSRSHGAGTGVFAEQGPEL